MAKLKQGDLCPLIGESCRQLECAWYTKIAGTNPQTGDSVEEWGCAVAWIPFLQVDNSKAVNQQGAAVESFRNEMVRMNETSLDLLTNHTNHKAIENE